MDCDRLEALAFAGALPTVPAGIALLGAALPRARYAATASAGPTPVSTRDLAYPLLTIAASLDGVARVTRVAAEPRRIRVQKRRH